MSDDTKFFDQYDRKAFITRWAKLLKCKDTEFDVAVTLINGPKNFESAMAIIFGLSYMEHKEWLNKCSKYFKANFPENSIATVEFLAAFQKHYIEEVDKYPG